MISRRRPSFIQRAACCLLRTCQRLLRGHAGHVGEPLSVNGKQTDRLEAKQSIPLILSRFAQ
jgi:hypothetical protein